MKKIIVILTLALCAFSASAQTFVRTNLQVAATVTNSSTYTYAETNFLDCSRYSEIGFENRLHGDGSSTNNIVWTFRLSMDATNWATSPTITWVCGSGYTVTNIAIGTYGYVQPYQRVSTNATDLTNTLFGIVKGYRRD